MYNTVPLAQQPEPWTEDKDKKTATYMLVGANFSIECKKKLRDECRVNLFCIFLDNSDYD